MVIAIDGPAGSGKSTVARAVAARLGFSYLDSGAMYRCVGLAALEAGVDPGDAAAASGLGARILLEVEGDRVFLDGREVSGRIRDPDVADAASLVSRHPGVRRVLVARQRELAEEGRWVVEGRDIGTVVAPDAPLKVFLTADEAERARRRARELGLEPGEVLAAQRARDASDATREHGALRAADDAIVLDTTELGAEEVVERIVAHARERDLG